jgi:hypothetical protein
MEGTGGQQNSIARRLLRKRLVPANPTAEHRSDLNRNVAPVARALGRDLGGCQLSGFVFGKIAQLTGFPAQCAGDGVQQAYQLVAKAPDARDVRGLGRETSRYRYRSPVRRTGDWLCASRMISVSRAHELDTTYLRSGCCKALFLAGMLTDADAAGCGGATRSWIFRPAGAV